MLAHLVGFNDFLPEAGEIPTLQGTRVTILDSSEAIDLHAAATTAPPFGPPS